MKKLLIGCGVLVLLIFCLIVGVAVYGYMKVKSLQQGLVQVKTAYEATNKSYPFTPPDPPIMRAERFQKYLTVRADLAKALEGEQDLINKLHEASNPNPQGKSNVNFSDIGQMLRLPERIGKAHVKALEQQAMSVDEYLWYSKMVTGTILNAAKEGKELADDLGKTFGDAAAKQALPPGSQTASPNSPSVEHILQVSDVPVLPENLKMVNEAKDELSKYPQIISVDLFLRSFELSPSTASRSLAPGSTNMAPSAQQPQGAMMPEATPVPAR